MNDRMLGACVLLFFSLFLVSCRDLGQSDGLSKARIIGGESVKRPPYFLGLGVQSFGCSASYIGPRWAVTAAHCINRNTLAPMTVTWADSIAEIEHKSSQVEAIFVHKDYDPDSKNHDIALLYLDDAVENIPEVQPILLDASRASGLAGTEVSVIGRGNRTSAGELYSSQTKSLFMKILDDRYCSSSITESGADLHWQFCAGKEVSQGGYDSCQGDSGGPVIVLEGGRSTLVGIVSWGQGCAQKDLPGFYTRIKPHLRWIEDIRQSYEKGRMSGLESYLAHCYMEDIRFEQEVENTADSIELSYSMAESQYKKSVMSSKRLGKLLGSCTYIYDGLSYSASVHLANDAQLRLEVKNMQQVEHYAVDAVVQSLLLSNHNESKLEVFLHKGGVTIQEPKSGKTYTHLIKGEPSIFSDLTVVKGANTEVKYGFSEDKEMIFLSVMLNHFSLIEGIYRRWMAPDKAEGIHIPKLEMVDIQDNYIRAFLHAPQSKSLHTWQMVCLQEFGVEMKGETVWSKPLRHFSEKADYPEVWQLTRISHRHAGANISRGEKVELKIMPRHGTFDAEMNCGINNGLFSEY